MNFQVIKNDPLKARIYTLDNGLKVYLTAYDDAPRVQTNIAIRAGSKNDPKDATVVVKEEEEVNPDDSIAEKFRKLAEKKFGTVNEKEIKSDGEFKEYAMAILKDAHGDKFDEAKAMEVVDGLKDKYKGDYGAMVGALQSTMGS